jgi:hypothetical protein
MNSSSVVRSLVRAANFVLNRSRTLCQWAALAAIWLAASPLAYAAKKKVEEVAAPEKSYVMPYMIVLMVMGLGLMTICRPSSRADKVDDKYKKDE